MITITILSLAEKEEDKNGNKNVEVVDQLVFETLQESGFEKLVPGSRWDERDEEEKDDHDLRVEEPGNQGPMKTHFG